MGQSLLNPATSFRQTFNLSMTSGFPKLTIVVIYLVALVCFPSSIHLNCVHFGAHNTCLPGALHFKFLFCRTKRHFSCLFCICFLLISFDAPVLYLEKQVNSHSPQLQSSGHSSFCRPILYPPSVDCFPGHFQANSIIQNLFHTFDHVSHLTQETRSANGVQAKHSYMNNSVHCLAVYS